MALLTDDRINAYVADKHREALQLGKDAEQQRKKDAASAEMTPSKAMTEATDDDSDSEEPKIFHPSKKQLNEKGKDSGVEKNNATLGKEKSTLQGIEETLLGDGDSDSDDRDFAASLADVATKEKDAFKTTRRCKCSSYSRRRARGEITSRRRQFPASSDEFNEKSRWWCEKYQQIGRFRKRR